MQKHRDWENLAALKREKDLMSTANIPAKVSKAGAPIGGFQQAGKLWVLCSCSRHVLTWQHSSACCGERALDNVEEKDQESRNVDAIPYFAIGRRRMWFKNPEAKLIDMSPSIYV
jgi:hypothetical protein